MAASAPLNVQPDSLVVLQQSVAVPADLFGQMLGDQMDLDLIHTDVNNNHTAGGKATGTASTHCTYRRVNTI